MNRISSVLLFVLGLATVGCGYSSKYMTKLEVPQAIQADASEATVVFVRPSGYAGGYKSTILDSKAGFLGECAGKTYFVTKLPPGEHMLIAWSEATPALRATLEAGKVYYVEVGMIVGLWAGRSRLFAIGPQREQWAKLRTWMRESDMLILQPSAKKVFDEDEGEDMDGVIKKGLGNYAEYDAEDRQKRTLVPADGVPDPVR